MPDLVQMNQVCQAMWWAPVMRGRVETMELWLEQQGLKYTLIEFNDTFNLTIYDGNKVYPVPKDYWVIIDPDETLHIRSHALVKKLIEVGGMGTAIPFDH